MRKIELAQVSCRACATVMSSVDFPGACRICSCDRFDITLVRSTRGMDLGFDPTNLLEPLGWSLLLGDAGMLVWASREPLPLHSWKFHDIIEDVPGGEIRHFLSQSSAQRRLFIQWKRKRARGPGCRRCEKVFEPHANAWHREGYCSKKCMEVATSRTRLT